jgi:hypothetical protein
MTRYGVGGSRIATKPVRNVPGGMAGADRVVLKHLMASGRPAWADDPTLDLPCQQPDANPDWWFDAINEDGQDMREHAAALCEGCPMRDPCRDHAIGAPRELYGVWGGLLMERAYPRNRKGKAAS